MASNTNRHLKISKRSCSPEGSKSVKLQLKRIALYSGHFCKCSKKWSKRNDQKNDRKHVRKNVLLFEKSLINWNFNSGDFETFSNLLNYFHFNCTIYPTFNVCQKKICLNKNLTNFEELFFEKKCSRLIKSSCVDRCVTSKKRSPNLFCPKRFLSSRRMRILRGCVIKRNFAS